MKHVDHPKQSECPRHMMEHSYRRQWTLSNAEQMDDVWGKLQRRETFVDGQIFPYRVEFDAENQFGRFKEGELNIHHGPFLSAHGAIGQINDTFRGLDYFYGAYVLSFRWIRPVRLIFEREDTVLRMQLDAFVKPWIRPFYQKGLSLFWRFFGISFLLSSKR